MNAIDVMKVQGVLTSSCDVEYDTGMSKCFIESASANLRSKAANRIAIVCRFRIPSAWLGPALAFDFAYARCDIVVLFYPRFPRNVGSS